MIFSNIWKNQRINITFNLKFCWTAEAVNAHADSNSTRKNRKDEINTVDEKLPKKNLNSKI